MISLTFANFVQWIHLYGAFAVYVLLAVGILGLPIPDETILVVCGVLLAKSILPLPQTLLASILGTITGISLSYFLGRVLELAVIHRLIRLFRLKEAHWSELEIWYAKYGKWSLLFGYFLPGIRHLTGVFAGLTKLPYIVFALFAYTGALIWSLLFLMIGYFFGDTGIKWISKIYEQYGYHLFILIGIVILVAVYFSWRRLFGKSSNIVS